MDLDVGAEDLGRGLWAEDGDEWDGVGAREGVDLLGLGLPVENVLALVEGLVEDDAVGLDLQLGPDLVVGGDGERDVVVVWKRVKSLDKGAKSLENGVKRRRERCKKL